MITRFTKIQLIVFAIVTVLGGAFVGGRYAEIDRLFVDRTYPVTAQFKDSGGIFAGAQVTYRGIPVGTVGALKFNQGGVQARLDIENSAPKISADTLAVVANKSAIGEQYIDLQPTSGSRPYLQAGSSIPLSKTRIPIDTTTLLLDVNGLVSSVDTESLQTLVTELGQAFEGTGDDLGTILDTSSEFINAADDNIDVTRQLIRDSDSVLQTQVDKSQAIGTFSRNLALFSDSLVNADPDLRRLVDQGTGSARTLNAVVTENSKDLRVLINNLVNVGKPLRDNVLGLRATFTLYPYLVQGSYSVLDESETDPGEYDATFGLVIEAQNASKTGNAPAPCTYEQDGQGASGYRDRRNSNDLTDVQFPPPNNLDIDCKVDDNDIARQASKTDLRRTAPAAGEDSFTWLMLQPATQ